MKNLTFLVAVVAGVFASASRVSAEDAFTRVWTQWLKPSIDYNGKDAGGNPVTIKGDGTEFMTVTSITWNQSFQGSKLSFYGISLNAPAGAGYSESHDPLVLGAGGLSVQTANVRYAFATRTTGKVQVQLAADQTWSGVGGTKIGIGDDGHNYGYGYYSTTRIEALEGVHNWTIDDQLSVFLFGSNSLAGVDVTVTTNAHLYLARKWTSGSPSVTREQFAHLGASTLILDGARYTAATTPTAPMSVNPVTLNPDFDPQTVAEKIVLKNGGSLGFYNSSWSIPELEVDGSPSLTSTLDNAVTLDVANTTVTFRNGARAAFTDVVTEGAVPAKLTLAGSGTLAIEARNWLATGGFEIGEGCVLEIASSVDHEVPVLCPYAGEGTVRVTSGAVILPAMGDCGEGISFEVAAGAKIVFAGDAGFDESRISGAGDYGFNNMIVTDSVRTEETITVNSGEILRILGNGLTTDTKLVLNGGSLRFERTASIASDVQVDWPSIVETVQTSATGTISGRVTCACRTAGGLPTVVIPVPYGSTSTSYTGTLSGITFLGPGTTVLAGGGRFEGDRDGVRLLRRASVHFTGGRYWFGWFSSSGGAAIMLSVDQNTTDGLQADQCCVRDGGELEFKSDSGTTTRAAIWIAGNKNGAKYALNPLRTYFDVCAGGKVTIPRNRTVIVGSNDSREDLRILGGELVFAGDNARLYLGNQLTSLGVLTMQGGLLSLSEPIYRSYSRYNDTDDRRVPRGRILWKGGTIKLNRDFKKTLFAETLRSDTKSPSNTNFLRVGVQFDGDATLDLSEMSSPVVTNAYADIEQVEWHGRGSLTVEGGHLVMTSVPKGVDLRLAGEGTRVEIADEAYAYDDAACVETWSQNGYTGGVAAQNYACKAFPSTERSVTITNLVVAGTNVAFASKVFGVTNRNVLVTGEWRVGTTLAGNDAVEVENMTFAESSRLAVSRERDSAFRNFTLSGTLAFPETMEATTVRPGGRQGPVLTAAEVVGPRSWFGNALVEIEGSSVVFSPAGCLLMLR